MPIIEWTDGKNEVGERWDSRREVLYSYYSQGLSMGRQREADLMFLREKAASSALHSFDRGTWSSRIGIFALARWNRVDL